MDAWPFGVLERSPGGVDVTGEGASESRDHRPVDVARDALDGLEVAGRSDREAGLDHVHAQTRELLRDLELLLRVQRDARRLLAVTQRRVEDDYSVRVLRWRHACVSFALVQLLLGLGSRLHAAAGALFPPEGEEKKSKVEGERHRPTGYRSRTRASTVEGAACLARPLQLTHPQSVTETPATNPSLVAISCTSVSGTPASVVTIIAASGS